MNSITSYARIKNNSVFVNGTLVFSADTNLNITEFLSEAYKKLSISYPKYHKMDTLCKLGFLCAEFAIQNTPFLEANNLDSIGIVLSNSSSSLQTDILHQNSISNKEAYFPSPAIFFFFLPNIIIGEIAIKHKITGENAFFVSEKFDSELITNYCEMLLQNNTTALVSGWVEINETNYDAFIFLTERKENINKNTIFKPLNKQIVTELYNT